MSNIKRFIKTSSIYFLGNVFTKLISFILLPLYTSKIIPEDFGYYDLSNSVLSLIVPLVFFQIWDGVFRFTFDYEDDENKSKVISNGLIVMIFGIIIYTMLFVLLYNSLSFRLYKYIYITGVISGINNFYCFISRAYMNNKLFVLSGFFNSLLNIVSNIILIIGFKFRVEALYISVILGGIIQIFIIEYKIKVIKKLKMKYISRDLMKNLIKFSLPIGLSTISYWLLSGFTRIVISNNFGVLENGLYAVGNRFCSIIVLISNVFQFAWNEIVYVNANNSDGRKLQEKAINLIFKIALVISPFIIIVIKIIYPYFIAQNYKESIYMIPIIFIGVLGNSLAGLLGTLFLVDKESNILSISTIIAAVINITFAYILIPKIGVYGPIIALTIGFLMNLIIRIFIINRKNRVRINCSVIIKYLMIIFLGVVIFYIENIVINIVFLIISSLLIVYQGNKIAKILNINIMSNFKKIIYKFK